MWGLEALTVVPVLGAKPLMKWFPTGSKASDEVVSRQQYPVERIAVFL